MLSLISLRIVVRLAHYVLIIEEVSVKLSPEPKGILLVRSSTQRTKYKQSFKTLL